MAPSTDPFIPRNPLERALVKAAESPAERGAFLRELMDSTVLVVGSVVGAGTIADRRGTVPAGARLSLRHATLPDGRPVLPFYSSIEWLHGTVTEPVETMKLPVRGLFENTRGATLILNYGAPWGKEFTPTDVSRLLDGSGAAQPIVVTAPTQMQIGLPATEPTAYLDAVMTIFRRYPDVRAAYVGWIHNPDEGTPPHLVIGVEGEGDIRAAMRDAGAAWDPPQGSGDLLDMMEAIAGAEGVAGWFVSDGRRFYSR